MCARRSRPASTHQIHASASRSTRRLPSSRPGRRWRASRFTPIWVSLACRARQWSSSTATLYSTSPRANSSHRARRKAGLRGAAVGAARRSDAAAGRVRARTPYAWPAARAGRVPAHVQSDGVHPHAADRVQCQRRQDRSHGVPHPGRLRAIEGEDTGQRHRLRRPCAVRRSVARAGARSIGAHDSANRT